ncbi:hypothetical protein [Desulfatitalea alkaliphila]|uniref:Uncharacterized protein n=1 Tax=Desulfatitalea alkaliphila TaxID=2929485 RepID=A0AA41UHM6_9BACT|nr:hypothetical protein [Desulfatitalea alkaliphila]MCJ8499184.1 hypothetical protein [Desulfatitalea alkaliphila]
MASNDKKGKRPLWLSMEEQILQHESQLLSGSHPEAAIKQIAKGLDEAGYNVSRHGGNLIKLRFAVDRAREVKKPLLKDFNAAVSTLSLEDVIDPYVATTKLIDSLGSTWFELNSAERRADVVAILVKTKLDLLIAKAKALPGDEGIRLLVEEEIDHSVIISAMGITEEKLKEVIAQIEKERAERARVAALLEKVADKTDEEKVRHLIDNNVAEALILEMAKVDKGVIEAVNKAMEEELKEKQRLAEEEAARKKKEAEGPALEDIEPEAMLEYIDSIREIMEFSDQEKEIRTMCEQSSIPKALVDIAVSDPAKLDELEKEAQG